MRITIDAGKTMDTAIYALYEGDSHPFPFSELNKRPHTLTWIYARTLGEQDWLAVGMGEASRATREQVRRTGAACVRAMMKEQRSGAELIRSSGGSAHEGKGLSPEEELQAWAEGWLYGSYRFTKHRGREAYQPEATLNLRLQDWPELTREQIQDILHRAAVRSEGTRLARDLVNDSPESLNPEAFVELVCGRWKEQPVQIQVYRAQELAERQMNGLLAVGAGSRHEPALIEITYRHAPDPDELPIALVGKGITFDMGGMNVKTGRDISDARMDMGGAAAVIGAMDILISSRARVNAVALIAVADNLPGPDAMLPSSVIRYPNGLTVQVANTDGEGRLILADALLHAAAMGVRKVIDIATLTGNIGTALGLELAGIWGDEEITRDLVEIGERNGERLWPMPLVEEYVSDLRSDYADLRNVGASPLAGAISAALFIRHFVDEDMQWVHIDMAGTVQYKREYPHAAAGATGYGARLLADYVQKQFPSQVNPASDRR